MPFEYFVFAVVIIWMLALAAGYYWDESVKVASEALEPEETFEDGIHNITPINTPFLLMLNREYEDDRKDTL